jgi:predicted nucleic acid-binding protein
MSAEALIDTNVFLYHIDDSDARKHGIATRIVRGALETGQGAISYQVVQEFLNAAIHKAAIPLDHAGALAYLRTVLLPLWQVMPTPAMFERGMAVQARYGFHFYDSLIVAAALEAGCTRLLSEDLQHGQRIETLTVENPFL